MKYLAAYMLSVMAGEKSPSFEKIQGVLAAGGLGAEADNIRLVVDSLKGKQLEEVIAAGEKKICGFSVGNEPATAPVAAAAKPEAAPAMEEKKKEAPKEESEDEDLGFGLFD